MIARLEVDCGVDTEAIRAAITEHELTIKPFRDKWLALREHAQHGDTNALLYVSDLERKYREAARQADRVYFERIAPACGE